MARPLAPPLGFFPLSETIPLCLQPSGRRSEAESREPDESCYYDPCHLEEEASLLEHARQAAYWVPQNPGKQCLPDGRDREQPMG